MDAIDQLDALIERRSRGEDPDEREELWKESVRRYHDRRRREHAAALYAFHRDQAERLRRTLTALIEKHEEAAAKLLGESGGE